MFLLGSYANTSKAYRLLDSSSNLRKIVEDVSVNFDESISYKQYVQNQNQERQIPFHKIEHTEPPLVIKNEQPDLESSSDSSEHSEYKLVSKLKSEVKNESGESSPFKILPQKIDKKEPSFLKSDSSSPPPPAAPDADSDKPPSLPPKTRTLGGCSIGKQIAIKILYSVHGWLLKVSNKNMALIFRSRMSQ